MDSIGPDCTKLKQKYEACFYQWYSDKYLTGKSKVDECAPLFKEYRDCLEKHLKDKKIDGMLEEYWKSEAKSRIPCNYSQLTHNHDNLEEDEQQQKANLRIGRAVRNIPEDYRHFFTRPGSDVIDFSPYDPNCKLILHVENILTSSTTSSASTSTSLLSPTTTAALLPEALEIEGKRAMGLFLWRIRFLWKWGHLFWILSDWQALKMEPIRIINPTTRLKHQNELKIYWQLSVDPTRAVFINKKISLKSLYKVQMARIFGDHHHHSSHHTITDRETITSPPIILMSGLNRYIFDLKTGYCTELHIDSVEPKIDRSKWATWLENNLSEPATV